MSKYTFYEDPGHGWLEVPKAHIKALGIAGDISSCSYESDDGKMVYLEEDCDMSIFLVNAVLEIDEPVHDWKEAMKMLSYGLDSIKEFMAGNVVTNDRSTLWGAPEIFIRRLMNYEAC